VADTTQLTMSQAISTASSKFLARNIPRVGESFRERTRLCTDFHRPSPMRILVVAARSHRPWRRSWWQAGPRCRRSWRR
jgi:hypothetical protein